MMENNIYQDKTLCVVDNGLFVELAAKLAPFFKTTYYNSPWESGFPKSNPILVGSGVPGLTRCNDIWKILDEVDLFVFPDVYHGGLQMHLESLGKRVWGSRRGEFLELQRDTAKQLFEQLSIPTGKYEVIIGLDNLRKYLKEHEKQWVKINFTRGDMETFDSPNYALIEPKLDELEYVLGAKKKVMKFVVEEDINPAIEIGYDGYTIDGKFPSDALWGIEIKDKAYVGKFMPYSEMPQHILYVNDQLSSFLQKMKYRNFFSTELRIKDNIAYCTDPCCRAGSPPNELYQNMYTNLADIMWHGADGVLVNPICQYKYGAEVLLHSTWADKNWQAVEIPPELRDAVKLRNLTMIDGKPYVVPQQVGLPEIGSVVATGDTLEEAINKLKDYTKEVKGYYIDIFADSLDNAFEEIQKLKDQYDIEF